MHMTCWFFLLRSISFGGIEQNAKDATGDGLASGGCILAKWARFAVYG